MIQFPRERFGPDAPQLTDEEFVPYLIIAGYDEYRSRSGQGKGHKSLPRDGSPTLPCNWTILFQSRTSAGMVT